MKLSQFISFEPKGDDLGEVDAIAQRRLAETLQFRLRNQVDPGIDLKSARRASAIVARSENGSIVIGEDESAKMFSGGMEMREDRQTQAVNVDDLFRPSSGIPEVQETQSGSRMVFRSISLKTMFGQQIESSQNEAVQRIISSTLREQAPMAVEEAIKEAKRRGGG